MTDNPSFSATTPFNPLQPVQDLIQGADPDLVCIRYGISGAQLQKMLSAYQASRREAAMTGAFTFSKASRNDPCPCGSGKKYKKCCLPAHEEARKLMPGEQLQQMEKRAREKEKLDKEVRKGFEFLFSQDYERAARYAKKMIEEFPEDDRFHDIALSACLGLGDYDSAFRTARNRWQTAVEEKLFFQENGYHKREGADPQGSVHFYSPSTWLEKFWIAQRARAWREKYPVQSGLGAPQIAAEVEKLREANDLKRFPARQEEGFEARRAALLPVLQKIQSEGAKAIPCLLPVTYNFSWAALFVPGLLYACNTDESLRLLAELSMFRYPYFSQKCLSCLEETGERAVAVISQVMDENAAFDELKAGILNVLGNIVCKESFEILARFTGHESLYVAARAAEALERHKNIDALPYIEKSKQRLNSTNQMAGLIRQIAETKGEG